ncbi:MAG: hypothetical protein EPN91_09590 [Salinibacterium sp.]|nr:MAG: hypothetical protein EPN91_09590 [Salinibacterium sp.]
MAKRPHPNTLPLPPQVLTVACEWCTGAGIIIDRADVTVGVLCAGCEGRGSRQLTIQPFSGRRRIDGIKRVRRSGGGVWMSMNQLPRTGKTKPVGISYGDFLRDKLP